MPRKGVPASGSELLPVSRRVRSASVTRAILLGLMTDPALAAAGITANSLLPDNQSALQVLHLLYGGFIITSLLWASALAALIDRQLVRGSLLFFTCGLFTLFGIIHSPKPNFELFVIWPTQEPLPGVLNDPQQIQSVLVLATSYALVGLFLLAMAKWSPDATSAPLSDDDFTANHGTS